MLKLYRKRVLFYLILVNYLFLSGCATTSTSLSVHVNPNTNDGLPFVLVVNNHSKLYDFVLNTPEVLQKNILAYYKRYHYYLINPKVDKLLSIDIKKTDTSDIGLYFLLKNANNPTFKWKAFIAKTDKSLHNVYFGTNGVSLRDK